MKKPTNFRFDEADLALWRRAADAASMSLTGFISSTMNWAIEEHPNLRGAPEPDPEIEQARTERIERDRTAARKSLEPTLADALVPVSDEAKQVRTDFKETIKTPAQAKTTVSGAGKCRADVAWGTKCKLCGKVH